MDSTKQFKRCHAEADKKERFNFHNDADKNGQVGHRLYKVRSIPIVTGSCFYLQPAKVQHPLLGNNCSSDEHTSAVGTVPQCRLSWNDRKDKERRQTQNRVTATTGSAAHTRAHDAQSSVGLIVSAVLVVMGKWKIRLRIVSQRRLGQPPAEDSRCPILSWIDCVGGSRCHGNREYLRKRSSLREGPQTPQLFVDHRF
ncbi:hypothetical protein BLNAU_11357 [Blattamonas nauphoetae]|uniref:Uncharacterized protein n=1 Tax=Blattamonas nauphoetae TaxID=2049346 RepID=A0ABQ9XSG4_9EUKA|nr:hypothetical protein BLNAU_11357 [Blattamonas nauphoetae]